MSAADAIVLVTPRSFPDADAQVRAELEAAVAEVRYNERGRALTADELRAELPDVDGMIAGLDRLDAALFESAPRLRVVARYGAGVDNVDLAAAERAGVVVTNTPAANADSVAELALALMLALARGLPGAQLRARAGEWGSPAGVELGGRTVGLLGLGNVGSAVAVRLGALGCTVIAHDPARDADYARHFDAELVDLEELLSRSQVLSLHAGVTPQTRDLIDARLLAKLPDGAMLVNTARGELIVEEDLLAQLESGHLAGAALDALRDEPPPPDHPLLQRDDVIVTPHIGAHTAQAMARMARGSVSELLAVLSGRAPRHRIRAAG